MSQMPRLMLQSLECQKCPIYLPDLSLVLEVELEVITSIVERKRKIEMDHLRRNTCKASI